LKLKEKFFSASGVIRKPQKDSLSAGGTTSLNRKSRKINTLLDFLFKRVTVLVTDFVTYTVSIAKAGLFDHIWPVRLSLTYIFKQQLLNSGF
jgi:hypothetical protein